MVPSLEWTGEALYDVANAQSAPVPAMAPRRHRSQVCRNLLDESVSERQVIDALRSLRVPRHLFKFMYRLLVAHCNAHTDEAPVWRIPAPLFESTLSLYRRDQDAFDRGVGAV